MVKPCFYFFIVLIILSCKNFRQAKGIPSFRQSAYLVKAYWMGKFDDNYLNLKSNGYFEYYKKLFGISKVNYTNGVYKMQYTLLLMSPTIRFDTSKITYVGMIDTTENIIRFVTKGDNYVEEFRIRSGSLKSLFTKK